MSTIVKNKKLAAGVGITAAAAAVIALGAGTYAAFFATQNAPTTTVAAGTLFFGQSTPIAPIPLSNLAPGAVIPQQKLTFTNGGTLPGKFSLVLAVNGTEDGCAGGTTGPEFPADGDCATTGPGGGELDEQLNVVIKNGATELYNGSVSGANAAAIPAAATPLAVAAEKGVEITLDFTFPDISITPATPNGNNASQGDSVVITGAARLEQQ